MSHTALRFITLLGLILLTAPGQAAESILSYHSEIRIETDGSMLVEEIIRVRAEGNQIRRGIYRDFPTRYKDSNGQRYQVGFELLDVLRDGTGEGHHTQSLDNGIRIYAGRESVILKPGEYTYTIRYRTNRQLGFFDQHDELYWNQTGNGWNFPIEKASARVQLPRGVSGDSITLEAYTGRQGARGQAYRAWVEYDGTANFETTQRLSPYEGMSIVVGWPKGHINEPDQRERLGWFLSDNSESAIGIAGILLLSLYYSLAWHKVGRDPDLGTVIPEYTPPKGFSPASLRFVQRMGYDHKTFSSAIINMAVAGYIRITEESDDEFRLEKTGETPRLAPGESAIASALFGSGSHSITLKQSNHKTIRKALKAHERALKRDYEISHFRTNRGYLIPGLGLTLLTLILAILSLDGVDAKAILAFMSIWLTVWGAALFAMLRKVVNAWRDYFKSGRGLLSALGSTLFSLPFLGGALVGVGLMLSEGSVGIALVLCLLVVINLLFYEWMKAPTHLGQQLRRKAQGFGLYLSVAEKDELNFRNPPEKTPELFEQYLPYAVALGVEQMWADKFTQILAAAKAEDSHYQPAWYHGRSWDNANPGNFAAVMGSSMGSAIASSSTAPGSSSGSGGGGFSGGGGGGGGGGGW